MSRPGVFGLPHLSADAVAAYADGALSATAASRARKHCAECAECAAAVREQREIAMMLRATPPPPLPSGLLARLAGLPLSTPLPRGLPTGIGPDGKPVFLAGGALDAGGPDAGAADDGAPDSGARDSNASDSNASDSEPGLQELRVLPASVRLRAGPGRLNPSTSG